MMAYLHETLSVKITMIDACQTLNASENIPGIFDHDGFGNARTNRMNILICWPGDLKLEKIRLKKLERFYYSSVLFWRYA